jgi:hypothetical protein
METMSQMLTPHRQSAPAAESQQVKLIEAGIQRFRQHQGRRKVVIMAPLIVLLGIISLGARMPESSIPIALLIGVVLGRYTNMFKWPFRRHAKQATQPLPAKSAWNEIDTSGYAWMPSVTESTTRTLEPLLPKKV